MKLLILGGTQFVGRATAAAALERSHELTLFNRGRTNPGVFPEAEHLYGDRERDLSPLAGRTWDAVVDSSGYVPSVVRASVQALAGIHYVFVSTISVYTDLAHGPSEDSPVYMSGEGYGELKAACERELPDSALVVRPGLVVGPHDPTFRFTYWVDRIARGGDVVAPEPRHGGVQLIDARDLGEWIVRSAEERVTGTYNAVGPAAPLTMEGLLETIRDATESDARLHWTPAEELLARGVEEWSTLPFWLVDPKYVGIAQADNRRALAAGLTFRPLAQTVRDTLAWIRSGDETFRGDGPRPGLDPGLEAELLGGVTA